MGGTGALGSSLAPFLAADKNNTIFITSRNKYMDNDNIHYIFCNAKDIDNLLLILLMDVDLRLHFRL